MVEAHDARKDESKEEKTALTEIKPAKIGANASNVESSTTGEVQSDLRMEVEKSLIAAISLFLREFGIRKSCAAVRDAIDISHQYIGPKEAVSSCLI